MEDQKKRKKKLPSSLNQSEIDAEVRRLKQKKGWNPDTFSSESPLEAMRHLNQEVANQSLYGDAVTCEACASLRQNSNDDTALCEEHLAQAMGF